MCPAPSIWAISKWSFWDGSALGQKRQAKTRIVLPLDSRMPRDQSRRPLTGGDATMFKLVSFVLCCVGVAVASAQAQVRLLPLTETPTLKEDDADLIYDPAQDRFLVVWEDLYGHIVARFVSVTGAAGQPILVLDKNHAADRSGIAFGVPIPPQCIWPRQELGSGCPRITRVRFSDPAVAYAGSVSAGSSFGRSAAIAAKWTDSRGDATIVGTTINLDTERVAPQQALDSSSAEYARTGMSATGTSTERSDEVSGPAISVAHVAQMPGEPPRSCCSLVVWRSGDEIGHSAFPLRSDLPGRSIGVAADRVGRPEVVIHDGGLTADVFAVGDSGGDTQFFANALNSTPPSAASLGSGRPLTGNAGGGEVVDSARDEGRSRTALVVRESGITNVVFANADGSLREERFSFRPTLSAQAPASAGVTYMPDRDQYAIAFVRTDRPVAVGPAAADMLYGVSVMFIAGDTLELQRIQPIPLGEGPGVTLGGHPISKPVIAYGSDRDVLGVAWTRAASHSSDADTDIHFALVTLD